MKYRMLGRTELQVSEIGFGGWGIGKNWWGETEDAESLRALQKAQDLGINFFDTAYVYGDGHSERLIAQAFRSAKKRAYIATKVPPKNMQWPADHRSSLQATFPPEWIISCTERSLKNLHTDCIELQQLHVWSDRWLQDPLWQKVLEAVERLKSQGKIRFFGISINDHEPETALEAVRGGFVDTVQVIFNLFEQTPRRKLFSQCLQNRVGILARVPLDEGGLSGKLTPESRFEEEDFRSRYFAGERLKETCRRAEALKKVLAANGSQNLAQAALRFCLSFCAVSTVLAGTRRVPHVEENASVSDGRYLDGSQLEELEGHAWPRNFYR
ncbi:MAG: aldo/keto reductase [Elusimicrobia bacterium]|nr:aldo/keto reductase [Elusimicrobiota bacterium]